MNTLYFKSSLSCGDMVYSLAAVKSLCLALNSKAVYYIGQTPHNTAFDTLEACKDLFEEQEYILTCERWKNEKVNVIDFDIWRGKYEYNVPIPLQLAATAQRQVNTKFSVDIEAAWLSVKEMPLKYIVFNNTLRYQNFAFDFHKQILMSGKCVFIGTEEEYKPYKAHYNLQHLQCVDLLDVALILQASKEIYCNQSAVLTIAQGLNKTPLYLAKDKGFNSTVLNKETIL